MKKDRNVILKHPAYLYPELPDSGNPEN
jgi:hypothetical protein